MLIEMESFRKNRQPESEGRADDNKFEKVSLEKRVANFLAEDSSVAVSQQSEITMYSTSIKTGKKPGSQKRAKIVNKTRPKKVAKTTITPEVTEDRPRSVAVADQINAGTQAAIDLSGAFGPVVATRFSARAKFRLPRSSAGHAFFGRLSYGCR